MSRVLKVILVLIIVITFSSCALAPMEKHEYFESSTSAKIIQELNNSNSYLIEKLIPGETPEFGTLVPGNSWGYYFFMKPDKVYDVAIYTPDSLVASVDIDIYGYDKYNNKDTFIGIYYRSATTLSPTYETFTRIEGKEDYLLGFIEIRADSYSFTGTRNFVLRVREHDK